MTRPRLSNAAVRTCAAATAAVILAACADSDGLDDRPAAEQSAETTETPTDAPTDAPTEAGGEVVGDGYSYAAPDSWEQVVGEPLTEEADTFVRAVDPVEGFATNINVVVNEAPGIQELDLTSPTGRRMRENAASSTEASIGARPAPIEDAAIAGSPAIGQRVDSFELSGYTLTMTQYMTVRDEMSYVITLTAAAEDAEMAESALRTVLETWAWE